MPLGHLEACTFGPHLGNWSVFILDPYLSPQNFALMELLINQKKMGSSFHDVLKVARLEFLGLIPPKFEH